MDVTKIDARIVVRTFWQHHDLCSCGRPEDALAELLDVLNHHGPGDDGEFDGGPTVYGYTGPTLMLYVLGAWELAEHGGGVGGAWLTDLGIQLRSALRDVDLDTVLDDL